MAAAAGNTATPIKYLVVIYQENVSFDHYFATYPHAANPAGEPAFVPHRSPDFATPTVNGLGSGLLTSNPNSTQPFRLDRTQNYTCDQSHDYTPEQQAMDNGLMDKFVETVGVGGASCPDYGFGPGLTMGYYDGNTVTALWNYAQHFSMNDNSFDTTFGPSTPGALNLISGQTWGVDTAHTTGDLSGFVASGSVIGDPDPYFDDCGSPTQVALTGTNIGDLLNAAGTTWGWFQGGFKPTTPSTASAPAACGAQTARLDGTLEPDYVAHHEPFQYYASTSNPHHLPPSSVAMIGSTDQANHQYDLSDFWNAANSGSLPAVSFLKAKSSQDGHAGYSSPLDEQIFLVNTINALQQLPQWDRMAVVIAYDDSDGWYDHVMPPITNQSSTSSDALTGSGACGAAVNPLGGHQARCGYGPRLPLLVISRWAKANFVDHSTTDQSSVLRLVEDNWLNGQRLGGGSFDAVAGSLMNLFNFRPGSHAHRLFLDPSTGSRCSRDFDERAHSHAGAGRTLDFPGCQEPRDDDD
jgi:phospholipase C